MPASPPEDEAALILSARRGDLQAFNALVLAYQDAAYTLAFRLMGEAHSAADCTQDAMIAAWRKLDSYRGGSFRAWLLRITANQCYDALRRERRRPAVSMEALGPEDSDDEPPLPAAGDTPEQAAERRALQQAIQDCISALAPDQRLALVLSDVEGLDYQAIAQHTGAALGTIKSRISRARASVRDCLRAVQELLPLSYRL
jgi:RNA polymerase sigma-70 factor (ECF subfamily)